MTGRPACLICVLYGQDNDCRCRADLVIFGGSEGGHMSTGASSSGTEPPPATAPLPRVPPRRSRLRRRVLPVAACAAAGLIVLAGAGAFLMSHRAGARPPARTSFCGLVACAVLHSDAETTSLPSVSPAPRPAPSPSTVAPSRAPAVAPAAAPAPQPAPGPPSAPAASPTSAPPPTAPAPTWSPVPPWSPPPRRRPPAFDHHSHHFWLAGAGGGPARARILPASPLRFSWPITHK